MDNKGIEQRYIAVVYFPYDKSYSIDAFMSQCNGFATV